MRQLRLLRNLTLKDFEKYFGCDRTIISRIENGHIVYTSTYAEYFKNACKSLRLTNSELLVIRGILEQQDKLIPCFCRSHVLIVFKSTITCYLSVRCF
ncbi:helix-turn-helix domain-containing protein [Peribacillus sp. NPDC097224]|uniref:helix-turn-helix domain-containing protein n=1 Tax=Peribacillus sp. NPDC097224 TaxID=3364399 RepID=UPI0037F7FDA5